MGFGAVTTSCEDMLTPDMNRYAENFSGKDTIYFYTGILRNVQDMVEQNQLLGDLRSDLVAPTAYVSDSVSGIIDFKSSHLPHGIWCCHHILRRYVDPRYESLR